MHAGKYLKNNKLFVSYNKSHKNLSNVKKPNVKKKLGESKEKKNCCFTIVGKSLKTRIKKIFFFDFQHCDVIWLV